MPRSLTRVLSWLVLASLAVLVSCANPTEPSASLSGYFKSSYGDGFSVSGTTFTQYNNAAKEVSFAGTIANAPDLSARSGSLLIFITDGGTWKKTAGTYYGVRWKNLTQAGVQESSASAYPNATPEPTTLEAARAAFADDSLFSYFGEYARQ